MRAIYILLVFVLSIFISCNENTVEPVLYGNISGIVYGPGEKSIVKGASITTNPATSAIVTSDSGKFLIQNAPVGNYSVSASKSGFGNATVSVSVVSGKTTQTVLFLSTSSNYTPEIPVNPSPSNQSTNQPVSLTLSWHNTISSGFSQDTTYFNVYLFESGSSDKKLIASGITDTSASVTGLKYNTTYYWQVTAKGSDTLKANSDIWSFTTIPFPNNNIMFVRMVNGNYQIFSSDSVAAKIIQITNDNNRNWWPRFNPKHNKIAFSSNNSIEPQVYTMNLDGSDLFKVTSISVSGYGNYGIGFCWAPDGYNILYSHNDKLYRIGSDGTNLTLIATAPAGRNFRECEYSPDGSKIVVLTVGSNVYDSEIYTMNSDGSNMNLLVDNSPGATANPSFSIDGQKILYTHDISGHEDNDGRMINSHIFEMNLNTKDVVDLSINHISNKDNKSDGTNDLNPRYSSNGAQIIFENGSNVLNSTKDIWIMNTDGSSRNKLISNGIMPDWKE